jgi:hypothetical protein
VSQFLLEKFGFNALQKIHKGRHGKNKKRDTMGRFGSDKRFLCKAAFPVGKNANICDMKNGKGIIL